MNETNESNQTNLILVAGTGRCGHKSLVAILNRQPNTRVSYYEPPMLPWRRDSGRSPLAARLERMRRQRGDGVIGDASSFYLPYVDEAVELVPDIRIVCLERPREEVVQSFGRWLDKVYPFPTDHWSQRPRPPFHRDPFWTRIFPQYESSNREEGIGRYWDEYHGTSGELQRRFPQNFRVFDAHRALNSEQGLRELLAFCGYSDDQIVPALGVRENQASTMPQRPPRFSNDPMDPRRCAILVPYTGHIVQRCEEGLKELEKRGYAVWRVDGYAAIDQGRNQLATDALAEGFAETMWIDSDVAFHPDSVDQLRSLNLPIACGIYPQKGRRAIASHVLPSAPRLVFGKEGGLTELLYGGTGFMLVRRDVYLRIQSELNLPMCNERFGRLMIPFFLPMYAPFEDGQWYLAEDYAFCQRAKSCGYQIMADTRIRLWHVGTYSYGWEDAGIEPPRHETFVLNFGPKGAAPGDPPTGDQST